MIVNGWFDFAVRAPLVPLNRIYSWDNSLRDIYHHSLEGTTASGYWAFLDPARNPTGWHGTVLLDGTLRQHAPITAGLAHAGAGGNPYGPGFESEGAAPTALTPAQVATWLRIHADMRAYTGHDYRRDATAPYRLREHREVSNTECPSERYAPLWAAIAAGAPPEEEDMADPRVDEILKALTGLDGDAANARLATWNADGDSLLDGFELDQKRINDLEASPPGGGTGSLPPGTRFSAEVLP